MTEQLITPDSIQNIGLSGLGLVMVGKLVWDWVKGRKNGSSTKYNKVVSPNCPLDRTKIVDEVHWLKDKHDAHDNDGIPLWYLPRSMAEALPKLVIEQHTTNNKLDQMISILGENKSLLISIKDKGLTQ